MLPKVWLEVDDQSSVPSYRSKRVVTLGARGAAGWSYAEIARQRGLYRLGPVRVTATDPFGFFRMTREFGEPTTVLVYPAAHKPIPARHRGRKRFRIDLDARRQFLNRIGAVEIAGFQPAFRDFLVDELVGQLILGDILAVDNRPARDCGRDCIAAAHGLAIELVRSALIHVAGARLIDEDRVRLARQRLGTGCDIGALPTRRESALVADELVHLRQHTSNAFQLDDHLAGIAFGHL